jgi:very-short-patch-repair endonuclease
MLQMPKSGCGWRCGEKIPGTKFRRQVPIGPYYADFLCFSAKLVIEVDGGQHGEAQDYDTRRTAFLEAKGLRVIRFWNNDVLGNAEGVMTQIFFPFPSGRGRKRRSRGRVRAHKPSHNRNTLTFPPGDAGRAPSSPDGRGDLETR